MPTRRPAVPLRPPSLLRLRSVSRGLVMVLLFSIGFGAFMFVFALTLQDGLHQNALHGEVGSGVLITIQQSGLALGGTTLGTVYAARAGSSVPRACTTVEAIQMGTVTLLAVDAVALPKFATPHSDAAMTEA
jgi:hypothetical protein